MENTTLHEARQAICGTDEDLTPKVAAWISRQVLKIARTGRPIIEVAAELEGIHPRVRDAVKERFASDVYEDEGELRKVIKVGRVARCLSVGWARGGRVEYGYFS
jgi:hypothetical protein